MKFEEYKKLSPRTLAPIADVYNLSNENDEIYQLATAAEHAHMALGMCSELEELVDSIDDEDFVNIGEELADIVWYVSGYYYLLRKQKLDIKLEYDFSSNFDFCENIDDELSILSYKVSKCSDIPKNI